MAYSGVLLDYFDRPRRAGSLDGSRADVGSATIGSAECGDVVRIQIQVDGEGRVADARFKAFGGGPAIAAASLAVDCIVGRAVDEAEDLENTQLVSFLGLPSWERQGPIFAERAVRAAIGDYRRKAEGGNDANDHGELA